MSMPKDECYVTKMLCIQKTVHISLCPCGSCGPLGHVFLSTFALWDSMLLQDEVWHLLSSVVLRHGNIPIRFEVWFSLRGKSGAGNATQALKAGNSSQVNWSAGIKIKNRPGLMGFRGVNLGIMMSGQALWWKRKFNCQRESARIMRQCGDGRSQVCVYPALPRL